MADPVTDVLVVIVAITAALEELKEAADSVKAAAEAITGTVEALTQLVNAVGHLLGVSSSRSDLTKAEVEQMIKHAEYDIIQAMLRENWQNIERENLGVVSEWLMSVAHHTPPENPTPEQLAAWKEVMIKNYTPNFIQGYVDKMNIYLSFLAGEGFDHIPPAQLLPRIVLAGYLHTSLLALQRTSYAVQFQADQVPISGLGSDSVDLFDSIDHRIAFLKRFYDRYILTRRQGVSLKVEGLESGWVNQFGVITFDNGIHPVGAHRADIFHGQYTIERDTGADKFITTAVGFKWSYPVVPTGPGGLPRPRWVLVPTTRVDADRDRDRAFDAFLDAPNPGNSYQKLVGDLNAAKDHGFP